MRPNMVVELEPRPHPPPGLQPLQRLPGAADGRTNRPRPAARPQGQRLRAPALAPVAGRVKTGHRGARSRPVGVV